MYAPVSVQMIRCMNASSRFLHRLSRILLYPYHAQPSRVTRDDQGLQSSSTAEVAEAEREHAYRTKNDGRKNVC